MTDTLQLKEAAATPLFMRVDVEFFTSMKRIAFDPLVQDNPPDQRDMLHLFTRIMPKFGLKAKWSILIDPSIEPSHPEWLADVEGKGIKLMATCDVKNDKTEAEIRTVFGEVSDAEPIMYCETNSTTHLKIRVELHQGRRPRTLEKVKKLAMLVLAFEEEIDKMLDDHVGYMNEDASARSNANNMVLVDLPPKQKLQRIWSAKTHRQVIHTMCPDDPSFAQPGWDSYAATHLNQLYKYNFRPANTTSSRGREPLVEFRQHQGTLSATEILYWMRFVGGLVDLADNISDEDLRRLVHMQDVGEVNITELFCAMAGLGTVRVDVEMVDWYTRKIYARGGRTRVRSKLRLGERQAGVREVRWRDLGEEEMLEERVEA